jgi:hypothetical protein
MDDGRHIFSYDVNLTKDLNFSSKEVAMCSTVKILLVPSVKFSRYKGNYGQKLDEINFFPES